jgi:hypothetical protein
MLTPTIVFCVMIVIVAVVVLRHEWIVRRNSKTQAVYRALFEAIQQRCIPSDYFLQYLMHLRRVISTRDRDEILQFDTSPASLLQQFVKQQLRNVDPEYKLFDERLSWIQPTWPATQVQLPATAWMNEYVASFSLNNHKPTAAAAVITRLDEAIDFLRGVPPEMQVLPGITLEGKLGVQIDEPSRILRATGLSRGYLMLASMWALHLGLVISHDKTWTEFFSSHVQLVLAFGPPAAAILLLRVAYWVRPARKRIPAQLAAQSRGYLFHSLSGLKTQR